MDTAVSLDGGEAGLATGPPRASTLIVPSGTAYTRPSAWMTWRMNLVS